MRPFPKKSSLPPSAPSGEGEGAKWVVVELSSSGEQDLDIPSIIRSARKILGRPNIDVFVPAVSSKVRSESQILVYMDGYVFIRYEPGIAYTRLRDTSLFREVLCTPQGKGKEPVYALLDDSQLDPLRTGMESMGKIKLGIGDRVRVIRGENKNLTGTICGMADEDKVFISAGLKSKPLILPYPTSYLEKLA